MQTAQSFVEAGGRYSKYRSQRRRDLRRGSTAARLLGLWVQIPLGAWNSVSCKWFVLSGRGLCIGLIPRPEFLPKVACLNVIEEIQIRDHGPLALSSHEGKKT